MTFWMKLIFTVFGLLIVGFGLAIWFGALRWNHLTSEYVTKLVQTPQDQLHDNRKVSFKDLHKLPTPVARYLRYALKEGLPLIRTAHIQQSGELRTLKEEAGEWKPFSATQHMASQPHGFVWDARIMQAPFLPVRVRDAYVTGRALAQVSLFSFVTLADDHDKPELDAGSLQRYLAESVWIPTVLLPGAGIQWSPIDDNKALATLTDAGTTVSLEFHFNDAGEVIGVYTPRRFRFVNGNYEQTPWEGRHKNYVEKNGLRIPTEGEVIWHLPTGKYSVWKGRIRDIQYNFVH